NPARRRTHPNSVGRLAKDGDVLPLQATPRKYSQILWRDLVDSETAPSCPARSRLDSQAELRDHQDRVAAHRVGRCVRCWSNATECDRSAGTPVGVRVAVYAFSRGGTPRLEAVQRDDR